MDLVNGTTALGIDVEHHGGTTVAALVGELDVATAPRLGSVVNGLADAGRTDVVLDLVELSFCDSTGLSALLTLHHRFEAVGGHLELHRPSAMLSKILDLTALDRTLHVRA